MNNSRLAIEYVGLHQETPQDITPKWREEEAKITRIIQALESVQKSKGWSTLKEELFDGQIEWLTSQLLSESKKETPDTNRLNRLTGELRWAEYYGDLGKLTKLFSEQLLNIKKQLHGTTQK